jgi:hypothetical protein
MNETPSPSVDRAISCGLVVGIICMTLLILGMVLVTAVMR